MRRLLFCLTLLALGLWPRDPQAQARTALTVTVTETAGMRRTEYPVRAAVSLPQGALADGEHTALRAADADVPAQYRVAARWPDGSVKQLDVDFNISLSPGEMKVFSLEYGDIPKSQTSVRGLTVTEEAEAIQVGNVRFSKAGTPLLMSATYRGDLIAHGAELRNGVAVTTANGSRLDLTSASPPAVEILKRGPLNVQLRFTGRFPVDATSSAPFRIDVEMPNSKSWVKLSATVDDPGKRLRDVSIETPLSFGPFPWTWDVATANGTYGALRNAADSMTFTQVVDRARGGSWRAETGSDSDRRIYETSMGQTREAGVAFGWGHFQGANAAVAFAIEGFAQTPGTYIISMNGRGQASFSFAPSSPATAHRLTVYEHFVATPVPIGAATSPASILRPPVVAVKGR